MRFDYEILDPDSWERRAPVRSRKIRARLFIYDLIIYGEATVEICDSW